MAIDEQWWPVCLRHLSEPYLTGAEERVTVAKISSELLNGYEGVVASYTALVPVDRLNEVLTYPGGIGHSIEGWGPGPCVDEGQSFNGDMWINGPNGREDKLEALVVGWEYHNKSVLLPDNGFLLAYGLCPRVSKNSDRIIWDDLSKPVYDVVSVKPLSHYEVPNNYSGAEVIVNMKYLQDYASLKNCALVSVFYEERNCELDEEIEEFLDGDSAREIHLPGRLLNISHHKYNAVAPYFCSVWGCRLILESTIRPISDRKKPELTWPGFVGVMTHQRAMSTMPLEYVYVTDKVLDAFEGKPEYQVNPESGSVGYDGWWALSYSHRVGRDFIAYEIKKVYEGCPESIIEHVHKYAIEPSIATQQQDTLGNNNIALRSKVLIYEYLELGRQLALLGDELGFVLEDNDVISFSRQKVDYYGWWNIKELQPISRRAAFDMNRDQFLDRCKTLYKVIESLKEKPLRRLLIKIGVQEVDIREFRTNKLLATIIQVCEIAHEAGFALSDSGEEIAARWDASLNIDALDALFALVELRNASGHRLGGDEERRVHEALVKLGIDESELVGGWGAAIDQVYEKITSSMNELNIILRNAIA